MQQAQPACEEKVSFASFLILFNISKRHNVGTLLRCAAAFRVEEVLLVGASGYNTFGSHGADAHVRLLHFSTLTDARHYVVVESSCLAASLCFSHVASPERGTVVGIEILDGALDVTTEPFYGPTAFVLGNEGTGLSAGQRAICDSYVYIPQFGCGTASLNVAVAAGIVRLTGVPQGGPGL